MSCRAPLDYIYITNPFKAKGYGTFGYHAGVDLRAGIGTPVYAPDDGKVISVDFVGNIILEVEIDGTWHRFLHLSDIVKRSGTFKKGQLIAKTGNTGGVLAHLHWDVRKPGTAWNRSLSDYCDPMSLISKGDNEVFENDNQIQAMYYLIRGKNGTAQEVAGWRGKKIIEFAMNQYARKEVENREKHTDQVEKRVKDLEKALEAERKKKGGTVDPKLAAKAARYDQIKNADQTIKKALS